MKRQLLLLLRIPCMAWVLFSCCFVIWNLMTMFLGVDFFGFTLLGVYWTSWMCRNMFFIKIGFFFWPMFPQIFFLPNLVSPFLVGFPLCICWYTWWCPTGLVGTVWLFFLFLKLVTSNKLIFRFADFFLLVKISSWAWWVNFSFQLYFQLQNFYLVCYYSSLYLIFSIVLILCFIF